MLPFEWRTGKVAGLSALHMCTLPSLGVLQAWQIRNYRHNLYWCEDNLSITHFNSKSSHPFAFHPHCGFPFHAYKWCQNLAIAHSVTQCHLKGVYTEIVSLQNSIHCTAVHFNWKIWVMQCASGVKSKHIWRGDFCCLSHNSKFKSSYWWRKIYISFW